MVTETPSELAELVAFPSSCPDMAPSTWGRWQHLESQFGWGGQSSGLSHSTHPSAVGMRESISTFPQNFSGVQAATVGATVLPLLLKLVPSHYTGVTRIKVRLSGDVRERSGCFLLPGSSQNIIKFRLLNTKEYCLSKHKPLVTPSRSAQSTTWGILEILVYCYSQCYDWHWRPFAGLRLLMYLDHPPLRGNTSLGIRALLIKFCYVNHISIGFCFF